MAAAHPAEQAYLVLPCAYGTDRIALLPRQVGSVLALWEITDEGVGRARDALGPAAATASLLLRLVDDAGRTVDIPVSDWLGRYYLFDLEPDRLWTAAVGYGNEDRFEAVATSAQLTTLRGAPAPGDLVWNE